MLTYKNVKKLWKVLTEHSSFSKFYFYNTAVQHISSSGLTVVFSNRDLVNLLKPWQHNLNMRTIRHQNYSKTKLENGQCSLQLFSLKYTSYTFSLLELTFTLSLSHSKGKFPNEIFIDFILGCDTLHTVIIRISAQPRISAHLE